MNNKRRILITGAGGMLGKAFYNVFKESDEVKATDIDLNEEWLTYLDVRDYEEYLKNAKKFMPDIIMHLAAFTDLEYCENNINETYRTNTMSVENAVAVAKEVGATLLYISTAGIFDGMQETYDDFDAPNPLSVYGRAKYMGERYVIENMDKYFVCRAGWMMGGGPTKDKKFINKIYQQIKAGKKELFVVDDKGGTPTYTYDFANTVKGLIEMKYYGVYNMVCGGSCSRYDVALEMLEILGLKEDIVLKKVESDFFKAEYFATRPASEKLINRKLDIRKLNKMGEWKESLRAYLEKDFK
jgi:dTDP-4-dehydrorhamnose reductase